MKSKPNIKPFSDDQMSNLLAIIATACLTFALLVVFIYFFKFRGTELSNDPALWGSFGDYIGGLVNPFVGLATVMLVVLSISIQRKELRATVEEMKTANFEQSLFAWLQNYHSQIQTIEINEDQGRQALKESYQSNLSEVRTATYSSWTEGLEFDQFQASQYYIRKDGRNAEAREMLGEHKFRTIVKYDIFLTTFEVEVEAPFNTLLSLLRWIDSSNLPNEKKWHYVALVRAQLSWPELVHLYYFNLQNRHRKLARYANKYALFDNLDTSSDSLIRWSIEDLSTLKKSELPRSMRHIEDWPYTPSAFDSEIARRQLDLKEPA